MSSRRNRSGVNALTGVQQKPAGGDIFEMDREIFGEIETADAGMQTAYAISIYEIEPDPAQPRRILPSALRYDRAISDVLVDWWQMAVDEAGHEIDVSAHLRAKETSRAKDEGDHEPGPVEKGFMALIDLAASIRHHGLRNPVTIYRRDSGYRLETGERRWLAHHLLAMEFQDEKHWQKIPAREVDAPSVWAQATENTAREDLNAISLARQLALLIMDIYREKGVVFEPYEHFAFDRHFYAQVADGREFEIQYGDAERVGAAMGGKSKRQVRQYRSLLRLPDHWWQKADDENMTEGALRDILQSLRQAEHDTTRVTTVTHVEHEPTPESDFTPADTAAYQQSAELDFLPPLPIGEWVSFVDNPNRVYQIYDIYDGATGKIYRLGYDGMAPDSIIEAQRHELDIAAPPGSRPLPQELPTDLPSESGLQQWQRDVLEKAYGWARDGRPWFSAQMVGKQCESLNRMVDAGLLEPRYPDKVNTRLDLAHYRIAPPGCGTIGQQPILYDIPQPPAGEVAPRGETFIPGSGRISGAMASTGGRTPNNRGNAYLFNNTERNHLDSAMKFRERDVETASGLDDTIKSIELAESAIHRVLTLLRAKR